MGLIERKNCEQGAHQITLDLRLTPIVRDYPYRYTPCEIFNFNLPNFERIRSGY